MNIVDSQLNNRQVAALYPAHEVVAPQPASGGMNIALLLDFARRRLWIIAFCIALLTAIGVTYFLLVPATYTATATITLDTRRFQLFQQSPSLGDQSFDSSYQIESQLELLKSEKIALKVINDLHLTEDPEFSQASMLPGISQFTEAGKTGSDAWRTRNALAIFDKRFTVNRRGMSFVLEINFESTSPDRAAQIANAIARAYIADQIEAKYKVTREGSKWLETRISDLRDQVSAAEKAVVDYKAKNGIVDAGGRLMTDQQMADLNGQLAIAQTKTSEARARYDRIGAALNDTADAAVINATAGEVGNNPQITRLRTQYLELSAREAQWSEKFGRNHLSAVNARDNMRGIRASILAELQRLKEGYKTDYETASKAEKLVYDQLQLAISRSQISEESQVEMRERETSAQTYKTLYDTFLKRYAEAIEQQSFPYTEARLVTEATPPIQKTYRKRMLLVAMTPFIGLFLGIALGALRDLLDRGFRTSSQIETMLELPCLALIPMQRSPKRSRPTPSAGSVSGMLNERSVARTVVDQPFSRFSESIRTIKLATDLSRGAPQNKVVGLISAAPGEGKSTTAAALAQSIAQIGASVVLVDCDLRNPSLSRAMAPTATAGLLEVLSGKASLEEVLCNDPALSMAFLPVAAGTRVAHSSEVLASQALNRLLEKLRYTYDYVVLDLPPLAPLADVRATTHLVDSYVLVIEWGRTYATVVQHALTRAPRVYEKTLGAVLNKVNMKALGLYDGSRARYYVNEEYGRYGYTD